ncbi:MAG TPA: hypothetical protein VMP67_09865, partial [Candidatus Limnocylindria bacterium]|nr:hypothetical protein [Candidatus Limnocylindria bacterium]
MSWQTLTGALDGLAGRAGVDLARRLSRAAILAISAALLASALPAGSAQAADATLVNDPFSRTASNSWGSAAVGGSYDLTGPSSSFYVNGSSGFITLASNGRVHAAAPGATARDVNLTLTFAVDRLPRAGYLNLSVLSRVVDARSHYRYVVRISPTGAVDLRMRRVVDGRSALVGRAVSVSGVRVSAGQ